MMKLKHLIENYDLAREALRAYSHDAQSLDKTLPRFRISSNAVYPYLHDGNLGFLRLAPTEEKSLEDVLAEIEFICFLRENGYPAMRPIPSNDGSFAHRIDTPWGAYCVSSFAKVEGVPLENANLTADIIRQYGRALGQLHVLSARFTPVRPRKAWAEVVTEDRLSALDAPGAVIAAFHAVKAELSALPTDSSVYGLTHYDFEPDNVFYDQQTQQISVIDFDDCIYAWYAMDVEQALDSLSELAGSSGATHFMEGYRSACPFTEAQEATLPLMRRCIDLRSYMRLKHSLSEDIVDPPDWMIALRKRLEAKLYSLESRLT